MVPPVETPVRDRIGLLSGRTVLAELVVYGRRRRPCRLGQGQLGLGRFSVVVVVVVVVCCLRSLVVVARWRRCARVRLTRLMLLLLVAGIDAVRRSACLCSKQIQSTKRLNNRLNG